MSKEGFSPFSWFKNPEKKTPSDEPHPSQEQARPSRREFLGALVAGAVITFPGASVAEQEHDEEEGRIEALNKELTEKFKEVYEGISLIHEIGKHIHELFGDPNKRMPMAKDETRAKVKEKMEELGGIEKCIDQPVKKLIDFMRQYSALSEEDKKQVTCSFQGPNGAVNKEMIPDIFEFYQKYLADIEHYGVFFRVLQEEEIGIAEYNSFEKGADDIFRSYSDRDWSGTKASAYSAIRAEDFIPKSDELDDQKIDPRTINLTDEAVGSLSRRKPWLNESRSRAFKRIIDLEGVRDLLQNTDCTLSEVFSIIKALIQWAEAEKFDLGFDPSVDHIDVDEEIIEQKVSQGISALLQERESIRKSEILGPHTDTVITVSSPEWPEEKKMTYDVIKTLAPKAKHIKIEGRSDTAGESDTLGIFDSTDEKQEDKGTIKQIVEAIGNSKGETKIFLNVHGSENSIVVSGDTRKGNPYITLDAWSLAFALHARVARNKDPDALKNVQIIMTNCSSSDFSDRLIAEIEKYSSSGPIAPPRIVAFTQRSNLSTSRAIKRIGQMLPELKKHGGLDMEFLMRDVQPLTYDFQDMTFFEHYSTGGYGEIGKDETNQQDKIAA